MIKHHPSEQVLQQFAAGQLSPSVSVAVSIHLEMCSCCQEKVNALTERLAVSNLSADDHNEGGAEVNLDDIFNSIVQDETIETIHVAQPQYFTAGNKKIAKPHALRQLGLSDWSGLGKVSRSRVDLVDEAIHSSLLHIEPGGEIPKHTHKGEEITVLLDGSFKDEMGEYHKGDFIWLSGEHDHNPISEEGCVCYAVVSDALHFSQGFSRLLNPIGKLIY
jgi:putative transcriptional regulator